MVARAVSGLDCECVHRARLLCVRAVALAMELDRRIASGQCF